MLPRPKVPNHQPLGSGCSHGVEESGMQHTDVHCVSAQTALGTKASPCVASRYRSDPVCAGALIEVGLMFWSEGLTLPLERRTAAVLLRPPSSSCRKACGSLSQTSTGMARSFSDLARVFVSSLPPLPICQCRSSQSQKFPPLAFGLKQCRGPWWKKGGLFAGAMSSS